jgi:hypothetical protein
MTTSIWLALLSVAELPSASAMVFSSPVRLAKLASWRPLRFQPDHAMSAMATTASEATSAMRHPRACCARLRTRRAVRPSA